MLLLLCGACRYEHTPNVGDEGKTSGAGVDSLSFYLTHHYWLDYNFQTTDSLQLLSVPPVATMTDYTLLLPDTVRIEKKADLVVADVLYVPSDSIDSVWVKVAHDQFTQGWTREKELLDCAVPDDPISKFIYHFSGKRTAVVYALITLALLFWLIQRARCKPRRMVHFRDIPSFYPTLLCLSFSGAACLYGSMQKFVPTTWEEFYFHPTLNPFHPDLPLILAFFIASVWFTLVIGIAVVDEVRRQHDVGSDLSYLATLGAVCIVDYLIFSLTTPYYIGYALFVAYCVFAVRAYLKNRPTHWACGVCGRQITRRGKCPFCGAVNQ